MGQALQNRDMVVDAQGTNSPNTMNRNPLNCREAKLTSTNSNCLTEHVAVKQFSFQEYCHHCEYGRKS